MKKLNLEQMEAFEGGKCTAAEEWGAQAAVVIIGGLISFASFGIGLVATAAASAMITAECGGYME